MASQDSNDGKFEDLRRKAQELIARKGETPDAVPRGVLELIQELHVHQVELAIQNEELQDVQQELSELNREYVERYYENAPCGYVTIDPGGFVVRINQAGMSMLGVETCNLQHTPFRLMIATESRDAYLQAIQQLKVEGGSTHVHLKLSPEYARPIWVRTDIRPDRDENGSVFHYRMTLVDITEVVKAEEKLRQSERLYRELAANLPGGAAFIVDRNFRYLLAEGDALRDAGFKPDQLEGKTIQEALEPTLAALYEPMYRKALAGESFHHEHQAHGRIYSSRGTPLKDSDGKVYAALVVSYDITERKRLEEDLQRSREELSWVLEQTGIGTWFNDLPLGDLNWDQQTRALFFVPSEDSPTIDLFWSRIHPIDREPTRLAVEKAIRERALYDIEHRAVDPSSGRIRWVRSMGRATYRPDGKPLRFDGINYDISNIKRAEEALLQLNDTLEQKVAERTEQAQIRSRQLQSLALELIEAEDRERERIAQLLHDDLQQLLASVKMKLDMMRPEGGGRRESDESLSRCVDLLSEAIDKTRMLSHDLSPPGLRISGLLSCLEGLVREMRENHGLTLELTASQEAEPGSNAVKLFLYQALKELLFNVVKHSGAETARIDMREKDDWIVVRVADSGRGAELEQVYARRGIEPGFGLFSIQERVQSLGGRMTIDTIPGGGWETTLFVPGARAEDETGAELGESGEVVFRFGKDEASAGPDSENAEKSLIRIVIVDDHLVMREGLASLLDEQKGMTVAGQAGSGEEALALVRDLLPDLVLMDVSMPGVDGIEATEKLVTDYPEIHVIGLSMHEDPGTRQNMLDAGAVQFLCKTDPPQTIIQAVRRCATAKPSNKPSNPRR